MTKEELNNRYFNWLCSIISNRYVDSESYQKLMKKLHSMDFTYTIPGDSNRETDGIDLRYRFSQEQNYIQPMCAVFLDDRPCSVLEMLVALSARCEEQIMCESDMEDRTGKWFWLMISNLGLDSMNDICYEDKTVEKTIKKMLNREFKRNGSGGLFRTANPDRDMRSVEIWEQMCWYLAEEYGSR